MSLNLKEVSANIRAKRETLITGGSVAGLSALGFLALSSLSPALTVAADAMVEGHPGFAVGLGLTAFGLAAISHIGLGGLALKEKGYNADIIGTATKSIFNDTNPFLISVATFLLYNLTDPQQIALSTHALTTGDPTLLAAHQIARNLLGMPLGLAINGLILASKDELLLRVLGPLAKVGRQIQSFPRKLGNIFSHK